MINGTKLLNVAGMTRGRRDGILKSEKLRHVVKIGPMHLKGVWYGNATLNVEIMMLSSRQDTFRTGFGLCKQGKDNGAFVSIVRTQYRGSSLSSDELKSDQCCNGSS